MDPRGATDATRQVNVPEAGYGHPTAQDACMIRHMSEVSGESLVGPIDWSIARQKRNPAAWLSRYFAI
jgi:hypothetical protein